MIRLAALVALAVLGTLSTGTARAHIEGCWINEPGDSVIELVRHEGAIRGRVVGLAEPVFLEGEGVGTPGEPRVDLNNPDLELRARSIAGLYIVEDLELDGERWVGGTIYDPRSGKTYKARAQVDDGRLRIRGYVGLPMFGVTTRWTSAAAAADMARAMIEELAPYMPEEAPSPDCTGS